MNSYNRNDIVQLAAQTHFLRDNLEKVLRLADVLKFISENPKLRDSLVLKGGTAINLTVFAMPRLSVDIDLDFHSSCTREEMLTIREDINNEIRTYMQSQGYQESSGTKLSHSLDSWVFFYLNAAGNRDNIKIEINYSMRQHVFEPVRREVVIDFIPRVNVLTLDVVELFGSKIKALIERHTCRDLYDVHNLLHSLLYQDMDLALLRKIVVFYLAVGGSDKPEKTFDFSGIRQIGFPQIRATLLPMLKKGEHFVFEEAKKEVLLFLEQLMLLTDSEVAFIDVFNAKEYRPELLFDDATLISNISNHPMAYWKTR